jgi:hypothetical protein
MAKNFNNEYVGAIPYGSNVFIRSKDGVTWESYTLPRVANWSDFAYGNGRLVAIGSGVSAYSDDMGETWTAGGAMSGFSIDYANGRFISMKYNAGSAYYSVDGISWTTVSVSSYQFRELTWSPSANAFVGVCGSAYGTSNEILYSANGASWSVYSNAYGSLYPVWSNIAANDEMIIALPYGEGTTNASYAVTTKYSTSNNGTSWTARTTGLTATNQTYISWAKDKWFFSSAIDNYIRYSSDGINWQTSNSVGFVRGKVVRVNNRYVAIKLGVANRNSAISYDGIDWTTSTTNIPTSLNWYNLKSYGN